MRKRFPLCTSPLSAAAPGLPVLRGVSGGGAALSPGFSLHLCSPEQIGAHFAAQSPERAFLAKPFFARAKNGLNSGRRSHKISVGEAKCYICRHKRVAALHLIRRLRRHLPLEGEGKGEIVPRGSTNEGNFGGRQSVNRFDIMLSMVWKAHCFFIRFSISLFVAPISSSAYSPDTASARIL